MAMWARRGLRWRAAAAPRSKSSSAPSLSTRRFCSGGPTTAAAISSRCERILRKEIAGLRTLEDARRCFHNMTLMQPLPPPPLFNTLVASVVRMRHYPAAVEFMTQMHVLGLGGDVYFWSILINGLCRMKEMGLAFSALGKLIRLGLEPNPATFSSLANGLASEGKVSGVTALVEKMVRMGKEPNVITRSAIIKGLVRTGDTDRALDLIGKWEPMCGTFEWLYAVCF